MLEVLLIALSFALIYKGVSYAFTIGGLEPANPFHFVHERVSNLLYPYDRVLLKPLWACNVCMPTVWTWFLAGYVGLSFETALLVWPVSSGIGVVLNQLGRGRFIGND